MAIKRIKIYTLFLSIILIAMAVSPAFALGEGNRNLLLIGVMALSPIFLILTPIKIYRSDIWLLLFMISIILFPPINHPESMRWSTVLYSIMFGFTFIVYKQLLYHDNFSIKNYQNLLKYLIYAYFIVLLIQQFCVLTGLPVFNASNYSLDEPWKLNALAAEPSHSARIVALLMYCHITISELIVKRKYNVRLDIKNDKWVWVAFIWTMVTMGSGTAFLFIAIVLSKIIRFKNMIFLIFLICVIVLLINIMDITAFERTFKLFIATLTFDQTAIWKADPSGAIRIIPILILAQTVDLTTLDGWFGHGIDYTSYYLSDKIFGVPEGFTGGGLISFWLEYGFISFVLFLVFSLSSSVKKGDYVSIILWFMLVFLYGINSQIVWLTIILLFTNKYYLKTIKIV